jgi:diguanylate cyclase (GGDEF)-like protein/PAS domain S-box-containing protein
MQRNPQTDVNAANQTQVDLSAAAPALLDAVPDAIVVIGEDLSISYLNAAARSAFGNGDEDLLVGLNAIDVVHPEDQERIFQEIAGILGTPNEAVRAEFRIRYYDAVQAQTIWRPVEVLAINRLEDPSIAGIVVSFRDLTREEAIATSVQKLGEALERTSDLIVLHGPDGSVLHANASAREFLGVERCAPNSGWPYPEKFVRLIETHVLPEAIRNSEWRGEVRLQDTAGVEHTLSVVMTVDQHNSFMATARDISEQKRTEIELEHRASHDALTGLPNRSALVEHLDRLTDPRKHRRVAVLFVDLDRFKIVNDSLGHHFGDELLVSVSDRFRSAIGESDLLARLGGDEFVCVIRDDLGVTPMDQLSNAIANRIHRALKSPIELAGTSVYVGASIGISVQNGSSNGSDLLRQADLAMFRAKAAGKGRTEHFVSSMAVDAERSLAIETELHRALLAGDMFVAYQPIHLVSGRLEGFEALVRWNRNGEVIEPAGFLAVAAESSLITEIDELVLRTACNQLAEWVRTIDGSSDLQMAVNLSARQLARTDIVDTVRSALANSGANPSQLVLEITESSLMTDLRATVAALQGLRELGVRLAIDDFGTGYSSLSYLQRFQAHTVKIDRSFIEFSVTQESDARIVEAIVALAQTFGMSTVAEGIETADQLERMRGLGCDSVQGYLLGRPVDAVHATSYIHNVAAGSAATS